MATQNTIEQQLLDLLVTKNFEPAMKDKNGQDARQTEDAKLFSFDYVGASGKNYGTMVIVLDQDNDLKIMYGDNLGRTMVGDDKDEFFDFIMQVNQVANRNRWTHTATDLNKLKYVQQGLAAISEGLFEGYYGTRKISYSGEPTEARLMIKHNHVLGENDKRYRYVESLYIETVDSERFKLGFKHLAGGRAMLEHVRQGGKPYDIRGNHITEMVNEIGVLGRFNRASQNRVMEGVTAELITEAQAYYKSLRENLKRLASSRGYTNYFESWHPATLEPQEGLVEDIKTMFIEQTLDTRIEAALPVLARLQQGKTMKEADIFENWANNLTEGTWQLPDTPEAKQKLADLLVNELPVGPDATNALEQLDGILGDDQLYDQLEELARQDADADARDVIRARMEEMGLEVHNDSAADSEAGEPVEPVDDQNDEQRVAESRTAGLDQELNKILKLANIAESRVLDESGETLEHILNRFKFEVNQFEQGEDLDSDLYEALFDYYSDKGEMPYGVVKARTGDPYEWITQRLDQELGTGNFAQRLPEADPMSTFEVMGGFAAPSVAEGSCNATMEGEYCPEHGLMECGAMESMGGTVAGSVAPVIGEQGVTETDDPINYNGAITGSYYESKDGDALLARIKSLALIK